jgi:hypothetical protein
VHQVAEVHGITAKDKFFSVYVPHPKIAEQYSWSGAFLAEGGDMAKLQLVEKSKSKKDVFEVRGWLDLDGDKANELWLRIVWEENAGDRVVTLKGGKPKALGQWSCGAAR